MEYLTVVRPIIYLCKMADRQVVLSAPLCFLFTKFGKLDIKRIKIALVDFYPSDTAAKERLVKDAQALSLDKMPTIARRRNSDNRYQRECDDMVDIITFRKGKQGTTQAG